MGQHRRQGQIQDRSRRWRSVHCLFLIYADLFTIVFAGSGGLSVAQQIYDRFSAAQQGLNAGDIAILDSAEYHYYQV
jgi:hypothetical protein